MKKCKYCNADLPDHAMVCNHCGKILIDDPDEQKKDTAADRKQSGNDTNGNSNPSFGNPDSSYGNASDPAGYGNDGLSDAAVGNTGAGEGYWQNDSWHSVNELNNGTSNGNKDIWGQGNPYGDSNVQGNGGYGNPNAQGNGGYGNPNAQGNNGYGGPNAQGNGGYGGPNAQGNGGYGNPNAQGNNGYGNPNNWGTNGNYENPNSWNNGNGMYNGYGSQNGYGPQGGYGMPQVTNGFAIASFVLGIASVFLNALYLIPSILALIFGIIALRQIGREPQRYKGKGLAIAGLIIAAIFFCIYLYIFVEAIRLMNDPEFQVIIQEYIEELTGQVDGLKLFFRR